MIRVRVKAAGENRRFKIVDGAAPAEGHDPV